MQTTQVHVLSAVEAARRIYNTPSPTAEQVGRVVQKIADGRLKRSPRGGPTTTAESVAEYLARKETAHANQHRGSGGLPGRQLPPAALAHVYDPLQPLVKGLLRDYFLAVVLRRKVNNRSGLFHGAVIATQAMLLVLMIASIWFVTDRAVRSQNASPEKRAVQAWLVQKYENADLKSIEVISRQPLRVKARFNYYVNGRKIESLQFLTLDGDRVIGIATDG
jgi:hypothetical protein